MHQGSVPRPLAPHHVARLPLPLQLGVDPVLLPPSHHGNALFFGCLSQSDAQPAVSIPQMLQAPPFEQLPQPWALAGRGQPQDELQPGEGKDDGTPPQAGGNMSGVPDGLAEQALLLQERLEGLQDSVLFAPENAGTTRRQAQPTQVRAEPSMDELNMLSLRMPLLGQDDSESLADGSTYSLATSGYGAQGHQANSLRSSEEFPADKENQQVLPQQQQPDAQKQGSRVPGLELLSDEQLALEAVYALQASGRLLAGGTAGRCVLGVGPAMTLLQSGRVSTPTMGATCLRSLLRGVVVAGKRRQLLEAFMAAFGVRCGADSVGHEHQDPTLQAFAEAVQQILRRHSRALQELPGSVAARREAEADSSLSRFLGSVGAQTCPSAGQTPMTALEVVAHTQHLQDADTEAAPILRFLLLATVQPYLGHMRSWLQSTTPVQSGFAAMPATGLQAVSRAEVSRTDDFEEQAQPGVPPAFLAPVHRQFLLAGQQLRILDHHSSARALVQRMATLAATEAAEARAAARAAGDDWAEAGLGSEEQSTASLAGQPTWQWCGAQADPGYVLAFKSSALEQIRHVQRRTCAERAVKVQRLLDSWQQQRAQQEANAADCREAVAVATQQKREAERLQKEGDAASKRQQREALLQEQKAAMGAADAARETKRLQRIRAEQDTLHAEAQVEHAAAMSAVQAAMHNSRQEVADLQKQAAHVAWRAERWELAGARRRTLQAQEAADRAELTALAKTSQQAHADITPQTPALEQADEVTSAQDQANEAGVTPSSTLPPEADGAGAPEAAPASTRQLPPQAAARPAPELRPDSGLPHAAVAAPGAAQIPPTEVAVDDIQLQLFKGGVAELPAAPYNSRPEEAPAKATALGLQEGRPAGAELHAALATCRAERTVGSCSSDAAPANADALELPLGQAGLQAPQEAQPDRAALASFFVDARSDSTDSAESWQDAGEQLAPEAEQGLPSASAGAEEGLQGAAAHVGPAEVPAAGAYRPVAWGLQSSSSGPSKDQQVVAAQVDPDVSRDSAQDTEQQLTPELAQGLQADSFRAGARAAGSEGTGATRGGSDGSLTPQEEAGPKRMQQTSRQLASTGRWLGHLSSASLQVTARLLHRPPAQSWASRQLHAVHWSIQQHRQGLGLPSLLAPAPLKLQQHSQGDRTLVLKAGLPQACGWQGMAMQAEDEGTEEALEPLPVVLDACIISSLLDQYRCISRACMGLLLKELRLLDLLGALRRYFFMEAGDWAGALTEGLCRHTAEGGDLQEHALQDALADALRGSSCEGDMYTERLGVQLCEGAPAVQAAGHKREPAGSTPGGSMLSPIRMRAASPAGSSGAMHTRPRPGLIGGIRVHDDKLTALDTVQLTFQVDWPLSAVVTEESLQSYGAIFSMLLRLKRVAHLLAALWGDLLPLKGPTSRQTPQQSPGTGARGSDPSASSKKPGGGGRGGEAGPQPAWVQQRLQALQLFRHEAAHFLGAAYMHSQLLGACWQRFQQRVEAEVVDISELHDAHQEYLRSAMQECLLSPDKRELRGVIEPALQRILDFRATLGRLRAQKEEDVAAVVRDDVAWTALQKCMQELQTRTRMLYKVLKFVAGRGHLRPLFLQLDLNQFYAQQQ
eukprot:jgi/Astpho2/6246/Aster-x1359